MFTLYAHAIASLLVIAMGLTGLLWHYTRKPVYLKLHRAMALPSVIGLAVTVLAGLYMVL